MRTTALVLAGVIGTASAHAQQIYLPMLQYGQQMQPMYQMQSPIQIFSAKEEFAQMAQDRSMAASLTAQWRPRLRTFPTNQRAMDGRLTRRLLPLLPRVDLLRHLHRLPEPVRPQR